MQCFAALKVKLVSVCKRSLLKAEYLLYCEKKELVLALYQLFIHIMGQVMRLVL